MPKDPTRLGAARIEGLAFPLPDLMLALTWAQSRPDVRLDIALDHPSVSEVIEIYPPGSRSARWFIWRTHEGRLRVDDRISRELALPYSTVETALAFIAASL
jgi:hypothetical protein